MPRLLLLKLHAATANSTYLALAAPYVAAMEKKLVAQEAADLAQGYVGFQWSHIGMLCVGAVAAQANGDDAKADGYAQQVAAAVKSRAPLRMPAGDHVSEEDRAVLKGRPAVMVPFDAFERLVEAQRRSHDRRFTGRLVYGKGCLRDDGTFVKYNATVVPYKTTTAIKVRHTQSDLLKGRDGLKGLTDLWHDGWIHNGNERIPRVTPELPPRTGTIHVTTSGRLADHA